MTGQRTSGGTEVQAVLSGEDIREVNKRTVLEFYDAALRQSDFATEPSTSGRTTSSIIR